MIWVIELVLLEYHQEQKCVIRALGNMEEVPPEFNLVVLISAGIPRIPVHRV